MSPFLLLSLVGGLLAIDDRAGWQSLLAQPVFAAVVIGLVTGQLAVAISVGLLLELVWLSVFPMRGKRRPDPALGSVTGVGTACLLAELTGDPRAALLVGVGALVGLVAGELGGKLTNRAILRFGYGLSEVEFAANESGTGRKLSILHAGAIAYIFAVESIASFLSLYIAFQTMDWLTGHVGGSFALGASYWTMLVPALGAAAVIQLYWRPHLRRIVVLSIVMGILVLWLQ
jgi:mannose/fructose/N-acetylgalactosamine-specific phosphotransferase system component IIC